MIMNNTTDSLLADLQFDVHSKKLRVTRTIIIIALATSSYMGNILILVSLKKFSRHLKGTPFVLLGNLAVADILLAVGLSLEVIGTLFMSLETNIFFCAVKLVATGLSLAMSGKLLIFLSFDRFFAIMFPMKHLTHSQMSKCRKIHISLVWIVSALIALVPAFVSLRSSKVLEDCHFGKMIPDGMGLCASVFILLQFCINIILCLLVMWRLRTNTMSREKCRKSLKKCGHLITGYVLFFICWFPFVVTSILRSASEDKERFTSVREYTIAPGLFNSAINWIVYGCANIKLRTAFKTILLCRNEREMFSLNYNIAASSEKNTIQNNQENGALNSSKTIETIT